MKKQPIRIEKVEKYKKHITRVEKNKGRKLKPIERLFVIYDENFLEDDTEQEEEEKGLSLKELYLVLYDVNDVYKSSVYDYEILIDEEYRKRLIEKQDFNDWFHLLKKTKAVIKYFDEWAYKQMRKAKDESEYHYFLIDWMRTRRGAIFYYNVRRKEDLEGSEKFSAKLVLSYKKTIQRIDDKFERNKREEEVRRGRRKKTSAQELEEERKKQKEIDRIEYMKKAKDWKGNPMYFDVDFRGVNLKDSLKEKTNN